MISIIKLEDIPISIFGKLGLIHIPLVFVGPCYFDIYKDTDFAALQINNKDITLTTVLHCNDSKDISIVDNGCIPNITDVEELNFIDMPDLYYPKSVTFSISNVNFYNKYLKNDLDGLRQMIKDQLKYRTIKFLDNNTIRVNFMNNILFLNVEQVKFFGDQQPFLNWGVNLIELTELIFCVDDKVDILRKLDFSYFGGFENQIAELRHSIDSVFNNDQPKKKIGILLSGDSGSGKTFIGEILASIYQEKFILRSAESARLPEDLASMIVADFKLAENRAPCILFLDRIEKYCLNRKEGGQVQIINILLNLLDGVESENSLQGVVIIGVTNQADKLDPALRRPGRLSTDIIIPMPSEEDRVAIVRALTKNESLSADCRQKMDELSKKTYGYTPCDLRDFLNKAFRMCKHNICSNCLNEAFDTVKPRSLKNSQSVIKVALDEIIGYKTIIKHIVKSINLSLKWRDIMLKMGLTPTTKILMFGPSGCGKSMLVQAISKEFNLAVISVRRSNILGKHFGETEKNLSKLFEEAIKRSPCILHFENFDSLVSRSFRYSKLHVDYRLINHLKVALDGIVKLNSVFVIAETNRPDLLDEDAIRHGRFHTYIHFPLPDDDDRLLMLNKIISDISQENIYNIAKNTEGFTMCQVKQLAEDIQRQLKYDSLNKNVEEVISDIISLHEITTTSEEMLQKYEKFSQIYSSRYKTYVE